MIRIQDGELRLTTLDAAIARAQELVTLHLPEGHSLSQELIDDRREEAARDE